MPVTVDWMDADESIILIEYQGHWTWAEAEAENLRAANMIAAKTYRCDVIGNFRNGSMESVGPAIAEGQKILGRYPENLGVVVVVTNPLVSLLATVFKSFDALLGAKVRTASSLEQAKGILAQERAVKS